MQIKSTLLLFFALILSMVSFGQSISTDPIASSSFCQNESVVVAYTATGSFNPGNTFTAELSDELGSFASPSAIGTLVATSSGNIAAAVPNLMTTGTQ